MKLQKTLFGTNRSLVVEFVRNGFVSGGSLVIDLLFFWLAIRLGLPQLLALVIGYVSGMYINFELSRAWTFSSEKPPRTMRVFMAFSYAALVGLGAELGTFQIAKLAGLDYRYARVVSLIVANIVNFVIKKYLVFERSYRLKYLGRVWGWYKHAQLSDRLYVAIRFLTCPFGAIEKVVPANATVLDIGCGAGLFAYQLAQTKTRNVIAQDVDAHKIAIAHSLPKLQNVHFSQTSLLPKFPAFIDAITLIDVLYVLPVDAEKDLLENCAKKLKPGGLLIIKEMSDRPRLKALINRLQESLSVSILRRTASTDHHLYIKTPGHYQKLLQQLGFDIEFTPIDRGYLHPHCLIVATKR